MELARGAASSPDVCVLSHLCLCRGDRPQMVQDHFEPSVARLFLLVDFRVVEDVACLNLGPLFAEASFEEVLPSDFVLRVN